MAAVVWALIVIGPGTVAALVLCGGDVMWHFLDGENGRPPPLVRAARFAAGPIVVSLALSLAGCVQAPLPDFSGGSWGSGYVPPPDTYSPPVAGQPDYPPSPPVFVPEPPASGGGDDDDQPQQSAVTPSETIPQAQAAETAAAPPDPPSPVKPAGVSPPDPPPTDPPPAASPSCVGWYRLCHFF